MLTPLPRLWLYAVLSAALLMSAACSSDSSTAAEADTATETTGASSVAATAATEQAATTTEAPTTTDAPTPEWVTQETGDDCLCADGSDFAFFTRENSQTKVLLFFQGGGACFSEEMCDFESGTYTVTADSDDIPSAGGGIFDFANEANPFADWSVVFVPYCTGDVHLGDATTTYSDDLTVEHNGFNNAMHGLDYLVEHFPAATNVFVSGSSAGGVPSPLFGGLVSDRLPVADIAVLADASGGYPSSPLINATLSGLWGTYNNVPEWPESSGITEDTFGFPDLFVLAGSHDPEIRMARYDNAYDLVQASFSAFAGVGDGSVAAVLDLNEDLVESSGINLPVYIAPGGDHTILGTSDVYDLEVEGTRFVDWLTAFVNGEDPGDVRCVECEEPAS